MNPIPDQDASWWLGRASFGEEAIARLSRIRRTYRMGELDQPPLDLSRLRFVRWLVKTGRLTDHPAVRGTASEAPPATGEPRLKLLLDRMRGKTAFPSGKRR